MSLDKNQKNLYSINYLEISKIMSNFRYNNEKQRSLSYSNR